MGGCIGYVINRAMILTNEGIVVNAIRMGRSCEPKKMFWFAPLAVTGTKNMKVATVAGITTREICLKAAPGVARFAGMR